MKVVCEECGYDKARVIVPGNIMIRFVKSSSGIQSIQLIGVDDNGNLAKTLIRNDPDEVMCARCGGRMKIIVNEFAEEEKGSKQMEFVDGVKKLLEEL